MITFCTVTDSLGTITLFEVEGRKAGYIGQNRYNGTWTVFFSDMADAPAGVHLERSTAPGSQGVFAPGLTSRVAALVIVRRAFTATAKAVPNRASVTRPASRLCFFAHHFTPVSPRSVPAPLARNVATPALPRSPGTATERAAFFDASPVSAQPGFDLGVNPSPQGPAPRLRTDTNLRFVRVVARQPQGVSA
ncbi:hypothetical protein [Halomonas nitroreducens]|uniref:Uncharacterized protein n=1 Tax=Halomonas nitroreducens TaxID=447425 RepID=A0A3S0JW09_9GAMM|nr:hypothetical protein [Halomonas nitroreducens]RTR02996.1 hypothetical protein EKG36_11965 [Halomonas nitroreducens]